MISARQLKNILDKTFSGTPITSFVAPTAVLTVTPNSYTTNLVPGSVAFSGTITPNEGTFVSWELKNSGGTVLTTGSSNSVSYTLNSPPSSLGTYVYSLYTSYTNPNTLATEVLITNVNLVVGVNAKFGQLDGPSRNITNAADLTTPLENALDEKSKLQLINLFSLTAAISARAVIVIPNSYGTVIDIQDNSDQTIINQLTLVNDNINNRKIYVSDLLTPTVTYYFKVVF